MLQLTGIHKGYLVGKTRQPVLIDVDLNLTPGEFTALIGPSGSGKSTLLNLCGLIDRPDSGQVIWQGHDISSASAAALTAIRRQHLGFVFQGFNLIPVMSVYDNVAYPLLLNNTPRKELHRQVTDILEAVGLADFARKWPDSLSGGQRQRVAIARALVKKPDLVVADEPSASLDQDTALTVVALMKDLSQSYNATVVVATHDARLMPFCDRVCEMDHGQLKTLNTQEMEAAL